MGGLMRACGVCVHARQSLIVRPKSYNCVLGASECKETKAVSCLVGRFSWHGVLFYENAVFICSYHLLILAF